MKSRAAQQPFNINVESGYQITSVSGCSGTLNGNIYTTGAVSSNCVVAVVFSGSTTGSTKPADYYCADNVSTVVAVRGNNSYDFFAAPGECIGTTNPDSRVERKTVPIEFAVAPQVADIDISSDARITKITNNFSTGAGLSNSAEYYIAVDVTNNGSTDACKVSIDDDMKLQLVDVNNSIISDAFNDVLSMDQIAFGRNVRDDCILAGETKTLVFSSTLTEGLNGATIYDLDDVVKIKADQVEAELVTVPPFGAAPYALGALTPTEMDWSTEIKSGYDYITLHITFVNMLNHTVKLTDNDLAMRFGFFDAEGYALNVAFINRWKALGYLSKDELKPEDAIIDAMGGVLTMEYNYGPIIYNNHTQIKGQVEKIVVNIDMEYDD